jgi:Pentapeptide repeats (9 copies)
MIRRFFTGSAPTPTVPAEVGPTFVPTLGDPIRRVPLSRDRHERLDLRNRRFDDLNANKATFIDCDFSYCVFERAYLHHSTFEGCRFIGSRFYDSNLKGASFRACDFKYTMFHRTLLDPSEMLASLPLEPNLRRDSLRNLRANAVEIGHYRSQRHYVLAEVDAEIEHYRRATRAEGDYYRSKYPRPLDRMKARASLTGLRIGGLVWGHGERPFRMVISATVLLLALTLLNLWSVVPKVGWQESSAGLKVLKYSVDQLLDAQPDLRFRGFALIDYSLIAMRYLYIGLFISVLARSASHR